MDSQSLGYRTLKGIAWGYISKVSDFLLAFLFSVYVGRSLGPRVYGQYSLFTNVIATILLFVSLGFEGILSKYLPSLVVRGDKKVFSFLTLRLFAVRVVLLVGVGLILWKNRYAASSFFGDEIFSRFISLLVFLLLLKGLQSFFTSFLNAFLRVKESTVASICSQVLAIVLAVALFSVFEASLQNVLLATTLATLLSLVLLLFFSIPLLESHGHSPWMNGAGGRRSAGSEQKGDRGAPGNRLALSTLFWKRSKDSIPIPWGFGLSMWQVNVLAFAVSAAFNILLMGRILKDPREIGFFSTALLFSYLPGNLISSWAGVILPSLSEAKAKYGLAGVAEAFVKFNKVVLFLLIPSLVFLLMTTDVCIVSFFGQGFLPAAKLVQIYIFSNLFTVLFSPHIGVNACYVLDKDRAVLTIRCCTAILNVVLVWCLVPTLRAAGAMLASCFSIAVQTVAEFFVAQKYLKMPYPARFLSKVMMAALLGVLCLAVFPLRSLVSVAVAAVIYGGVMFCVFHASKLLTSEDKAFLERISPGMGRWTKYL